MDRYSAIPRRSGAPLDPAACHAIGAAPADVVLKGVDELVTDDMVGLLERSAEGDDDPPLERFGDPAHPFRDELGKDGRLLELGVAGVDDQRLPSAELVVEETRIALVPPLGHLGRDADGGLSEIDVKMLGFRIR
jgi:hypothetical protein